eukprot:jgi/Orpsp1_1/1174549/evm.model.c7180000050539.1
MKFFEFGKENKTTILIFCGGGACWKAGEENIKKMAKTYHVIVDAYDGYNPDEPEKEYDTTEKEGDMAVEYIVQNYNGKLDIAYGISYGCYVLMEFLKHKEVQVKIAIADGMASFAFPNITSELGKKIFCTFFTVPVYYFLIKAGPLRVKMIAKAIGRKEEEVRKLIYRDCTLKTFWNQDYCMLGKEFPYDVFNNSKFYVWYGVKGVTDKKLQKNIEKLREKGCQFTYKEFNDLGHGGFMSNPDRF